MIGNQYASYVGPEKYHFLPDCLAGSIVSAKGFSWQGSRVSERRSPETVSGKANRILTLFAFPVAQTTHHQRGIFFSFQILAHLKLTRNILN